MTMYFEELLICAREQGHLNLDKITGIAGIDIIHITMYCGDLLLLAQILDNELMKAKEVLDLE